MGATPRPQMLIVDDDTDTRRVATKSLVGSSAIPLLGAGAVIPLGRSL